MQKSFLIFHMIGIKTHFGIKCFCEDPSSLFLFLFMSYMGLACNIYIHFHAEAAL